MKLVELRSIVREAIREALTVGRKLSMSLDQATSYVTAYDDYPSLRAAAQRDRRWRPTLKIGESDDLRTRRAKELVARALVRDGIDVYTGDN